MIDGIADWVDSRLHLARAVRRALRHVFPDHWSFMLGEIALYSLVLLIITGLYLTMFFTPSATPVIYHGTYRALDGVSISSAYRSILHITFDVSAGLLIRQMHHWAALVFVAAIVLHLARIFFTAAYRRPREINWIIGLTLLLLSMGNGFLGYSIVGDLLSGTGLRIAYSLMLSIPIVGAWLTFIAFGGAVPSDAAIPRMYALHILVIPALLVSLLALHLAIIWRQKHTNYPGPGRTDRSLVGSRLWPSYAAKSVGLCLLVFGVIAALGAFVQINPIWVYGPDNPAAVLPSAQPDWYLGWMEGALRLFPGIHLRLGDRLIPEVFFPGIAFPLLFFAALYAFPFVTECLSRDDRPHNVLRLPYQQPLTTALGSAVFAFLLVLFVAGSDDVIAVAVGGSVVAIRTLLQLLVFVVPVLTGGFVYAACVIVRRRRTVNGIR